MALDVSHEKEEIRVLQFEWFEHHKTSIFSSKHVIWQEIKLLIKEARRNAKYLGANLEPSSGSTWFYRRNCKYRWFSLKIQWWQKEMDNCFSIYSLVDVLKLYCIGFKMSYLCWITNFRVFKLKLKFSKFLRFERFELNKGSSGQRYRDLTPQAQSSERNLSSTIVPWRDNFDKLSNDFQIN